MGEISEMILEGILCQGCGVYMGEGEGYPVTCPACKAEADSENGGPFDEGAGDKNNASV
jgi:hypothetical protein